MLLDRDGVLNEIVVHPELGTVDSPLHPDQVQIPRGIPEALRDLTQAGYLLSIVTNQPAAAKGKTTLENLKKTHERVLEEIQSAGGKILSSHLCLHRQEDQCACRKPKTLLLEEALGRSQAERSVSWMIGDGVTDIQAGAALGLKTAFLGPRKCDACKVMETRGLVPTFWGKNLTDFVSFLLKRKSYEHQHQDQHQN